MSEKIAQELSINWERSIYIDVPIDDELVRRLTPSILKLRQENSNPISVAIDSPGGSLASLDVLLGLLTGPTQKGETGSIITVATNRSYSAAANLLAFGNYAVALKHSTILFHDVRYGGIQDVTPSKARAVAKSLQDANDSFALRLADKIINRLIWIFVDLEPKFDDVCKKFPIALKRYQTALGDLAFPIAEKHFVDIASFATCLYAQLSSDNDVLIDNVMERLGKWVILRKLAESFPAYRAKGTRKAGLLDGAKDLHKLLFEKSECFEKSEFDLKLMLTLLIAELSDTNVHNSTFFGRLDDATRNFVLIQSMNDKKHQKSATKLMMRNEFIFFNKPLKDLDDQQKREVLAQAAPYAQLFWLFCVSLCRELFEGEHILTPEDGQLLGLVDEVAGGGPIESLREYRDREAKKELEKNEE